jgi:tetratricopeptide (TPR) repeat protein
MQALRAILGVAGFACCALAGAQPGDDGKLGARAVEAGRYEEALSLLTKAVERDPGDAAAWLDKGRAIAMMNAGKPPDDYCDADTNWIFLALANVAQAMRLDPRATAARHDDDRSAFSGFKATPEFRQWWTAIGSLPSTNEQLRAFLRENPVWNREGAVDSTREALTLRPDGRVDLYSGGRRRALGKWRVNAGQLVIAGSRKVERYDLQRTPFFLQAGKLQFEKLLLGDDWALGAIRHDCHF